MSSQTFFAQLSQAVDDKLTDELGTLLPLVPVYLQEILLFKQDPSNIPFFFYKSQFFSLLVNVSATYRLPQQYSTIPDLNRNQSAVDYFVKSLLLLPLLDTKLSWPGDNLSFQQQQQPHTDTHFRFPQQEKQFIFGSPRGTVMNRDLLNPSSSNWMLTETENCCYCDVLGSFLKDERPSRIISRLIENIWFDRIGLGGGLNHLLHLLKRDDCGILKSTSFEYIRNLVEVSSIRNPVLSDLCNFFGLKDVEILEPENPRHAESVSLFHRMIKQPVMSFLFPTESRWTHGPLPKEFGLVLPIMKEFTGNYLRLGWLRNLSEWKWLCIGCYIIGFFMESFLIRSSLWLVATISMFMWSRS
jgi:hypothetical protein